jgi:O-antigen/teichoic acid export membrane protein
MRVGVYFSGTLFAILFVVAFRGGATGRLLGPLIGTGAGAVVSLLLFRKEIENLKLKPSFLGPSLAYGVPLVPHSLFKEVVEFSDRLFLNHFRTLAETGIYSIGYALAGALHLSISGFNAAWAPFMYDLASRYGEEAKAVFSRIASYYVAVVVGAGLALILFSRELVALLLAREFSSASAVIPIIAGAFIIKGFTNMVSNQLHYMMKTKRILFATVFAGSLNLLLNWLWIPIHGMMGAAWATLLSYSAEFVVTFYLSWRAYPIRYEARIGLPVLFGIPFVLAEQWLNWNWQLNMLITIPVKILMLALYTSVLLRVFLTKGESARLLEISKNRLAVVTTSLRSLV